MRIDTLTYTELLGLLRHALREDRQATRALTVLEHRIRAERTLHQRRLDELEQLRYRSVP